MKRIHCSRHIVLLGLFPTLFVNSNPLHTIVRRIISPVAAPWKRTTGKAFVSINHVVGFVGVADRNYLAVGHWFEIGNTIRKTAIKEAWTRTPNLRDARQVSETWCSVCVPVCFRLCFHDNWGFPEKNTWYHSSSFYA